MNNDLNASGINSNSTARILLVDDNTTNLQLLHETLDGLGYRLLIAKNGRAALAIAQKANPSLILLDIMMPGIDGFESTSRIKINNPEIAVANIAVNSQYPNKINWI